jgi:hypothetical protein
MSRLVEPKLPKERTLAADMAGGGDAQKTINEIGERIAKYVPAEILALYTSAVSLIATANAKDAATKRLWLFGLAGLFFLIVTPLWLGRFSDNANIKRTNQLMGLAAFAVWAYAFPAGWFHDRGLYDPIIAGLLLIVFTVISAFVTPKRG